jgi:hypothetical protein
MSAESSSVELSPFIDPAEVEIFHKHQVSSVLHLGGIARIARPWNWKDDGPIT